MVPIPLSQAGPVLLSCSLILYKKNRKRKIMTFLVKIATQGISL
jgi:hypothetical protein